MPRKGQKTSEATKQKMREQAKLRWKDPEYRENYTKRRKGFKHTEESKEQMSESSKGKKFPDRKKVSKEVRENMSKIVSDLYLSGKMKNQHKNYQNGHFFSKKNNKKIWYRSSYELTAYKKLENDSNVLGFKEEPFKIAYKWKGIMKHTIPDILVSYKDGSKRLIEVKPKKKLKDHKTCAKIIAMYRYAEEQKMIFHIWTEKELNI